MSSSSHPSLSPTSPTFDGGPPRTILPRSQPPRHQSTPALPVKTPVPMAATVSLPPSAPPAGPIAPFSQPPSTASTTSTSSSFFRPTTAPSSSSAFAGPSRPLSPPQNGNKIRPLTSSSGGASSSSAALATSLGGSSGAIASAAGTAAAQPPVTGVAKMAVAAKRGVTGADGLPRSRRGSQAVPVEEDDHPLSEKCLKARDYQTLHTLSHLFHLPSRWKLIRPLGQGAYGLVISVQDTLSGEPVAVKCITRVFDKVILARRALREITLLRHFGDHENLTGLIDLDNVWFGYNEIYLYMEPMEADLHQIVRSGQTLSNTHIQFFLYQLLRGMKYIHSANVIHRDLKPGNLLVNSDCELKICDFGLARGFRPVAGETNPDDPKLTEYVATRWYRAPEIMLSNRRYTTAIDVWSIGCILGELLGGQPMFKGKDYVEQLNLILQAVGTPPDEVVASIASEKACAYMRTLPHYDPVDFASVLPDAYPQALDLLQQLLQFSPHDRIDVVQALEHAYVATYHDETDEPSCPCVFDKWEQVEGLETIEELREAITREIDEYRAEVRNIVIESEDEDEDCDLDPQVDEYDMLEGESEQTITVSPSKPLASPTVPPRNAPSASASASPTISQKDLGIGLSPRTIMNSLPAVTRTRSRGRGHTPQSPATEEFQGVGVPISRTSSRRTSGHSMQGRRPASFLFSPFGSGMTPLPSTIGQATSTAMGQGPGQGASNLYAISSSTAGSSAGVPGPGGAYGHGHAHSASLDYHTSAAAGRRSRAPSTTGDFSLRPLIRQLSTVGMGVGGDDGVPVPGVESSRPGLGMEGLPPPAAQVVGGDDGLPDRGLPPMRVSPSDAPPTTAPKSYGMESRPSGPPSPKADEGR